MADRSYDPKMFERVLLGAFDAGKRDYPAYVNGSAIASGTSDPMVSPIDDTIIFGDLQDPEPGTVEMAAESLARNSSEWASKTGAERASILEKAADELESKRYLAGALVLVASGMCRDEAMAEADRAVEALRAAAEQARTAKGRPRGVWAVIAMRSSPLAAPIGHAAMALAGGNSAVIMPSGRCARPAYFGYDLLIGAGVSPGALAIVADRLDRRAIDLADDEHVAGIVASGTGKAIEDLMFSFVDESVAFVNEVKGMNPIVVSRPADMKKAAADVLESAFRYAGQRLYSTSKVLVRSEDEGAFVRALIERAKDMKIGDPADADTYCGPLLDDEAEERFLKFCSAHEDFAMFGGKRVSNESTERGRYYVPAIFVGIPEDDDDALIDPSAPVLIVRTFATAEQAATEIEETECGLSVGVMSTDQSTISAIKKAAGDATVFVNRSSLTLDPVSRVSVSDYLRRGLGTRPGRRASRASRPRPLSPRPRPSNRV